MKLSKYQEKQNLKRHWLSYYKSLIKPTKAELKFKDILREINIKFMFQKGFLANHKTFCIADFYIPKPHKLIIEIDGPYHNSVEQKKKDLEKEYYYKSRGFTVIRFTNDQVFNNSEIIKSMLESHLSTP